MSRTPHAVPDYRPRLLFFELVNWHAGGEAACRVRELYLAGHRQKAAWGIRKGYCDKQYLLRPQDRISYRHTARKDCATDRQTVGSLEEEAPALKTDLTSM